MANSSEKFSRDGARYVCKKCKQKYFTRVEVEACYDSHKD
jgi:transposase-like protein